MRFLVDENLSPQLCMHLAALGDEVTHVQDVVGAGASDQTIFKHAVRTRSVVVTADTDFGALLARTRTSEPSVVLVRELLSLPVAEQGRLLAANLGQVRAALAEGAIVVFSLTDIRVRPLPLGR